MQQSPAIDVLALGYSDGLISLYDIKSDEELLRMRMDGDVSINSITFRTDGEHIMATAASNGFIAFWNLNEGGRLVNVLRDAHSESTSKIDFLPNQPVLVSSSGDNSVKVGCLHLSIVTLTIITAMVIRLTERSTKNP